MDHTDGSSSTPPPLVQPEPPTAALLVQIEPPTAPLEEPIAAPDEPTAALEEPIAAFDEPTAAHQEPTAAPEDSVLAPRRLSGHRWLRHPWLESAWLRHRRPGHRRARFPRLALRMKLAATRHKVGVVTACVVLVLTAAASTALATRHSNAGALGSDGTAASISSHVFGGADTPDAARLFGQGRHVGHLPAATTAPAPAPPSLADAAPLRPHEVFGFAPYWTLPSSGGFELSGISTLAYFSLDVNANGTLDQSGAGWNGYESQALSSLVTRAHAAGDHVVLTVTDFDQGSLNALTSSPAAAKTLASALVGAVSAKNLDGINLDFEGEGDADQAGLTRLVATVSAAVRAANPHDQVTMDTYASSASDTNGFYDVPALAPLVDAFFVMEYSPNLAASASSSSPLTSGLFSVQTTVDEYAAAVPPSKVILGLPYFGIDWATTNGTLTASATGPATDVSLGDVLSGGHPLYWDPVTDSGWTSYQVGQQWHETFFEDPPALYAAAQLAQSHNLAGVGIWALGMDGNDGDDLAALDGFAATVKDPTGPLTTSASPPATASPAPPASSPTPPSHAAAPPASPPAAPTTTTTTPSRTTTTTRPPTTTTTVPSHGGGPYTYTGIWDLSPVTLAEVSGTAVPATQGDAPVGQLSDFATNDPAASCLASGPALAVWQVNGIPGEYLAVATSPTDCVNADFEFSAS